MTDLGDFEVESAHDLRNGILYFFCPFCAGIFPGQTPSFCMEELMLHMNVEHKSPRVGNA